MICYKCRIDKSVTIEYIDGEHECAECFAKLTEKSKENIANAVKMNEGRVRKAKPKEKTMGGKAWIS